ncbi:MAG: flavin-containing monooxygenase, partial [Sciscionella sp.]
SHMYSFSFEQNPQWSRTFSRQPELFDYLKDVADKYRLRRHIDFGVEVTGARYDEEEQRWHVSTAAGETYLARAVVSGAGALHIPQVPALPGLARFAGKTFHSAQWDHDYDLRGKRVAVIGTGASAIQFVPQIAGDVAQLHLFQRTPPWVMPKPDRPVPAWLRWTFSHLPFAQRAYRSALYWSLEATVPGFNGMAPQLMKVAERIARRRLAHQVVDPEVRRKLTPDYSLGCKRVLLSNDYLPTFNRDNVHVVNGGIAEVTERSVIAADGTETEVDAIIFGTGFKVIDALEHLEFIGRDGVNLGKQFAEKGLDTYLGINVAGFPNLFLLLGPNTGLGHTSVVFMIEQQARYVVACLDQLKRRRAATMDVRGRAQQRFNADIQRKLNRSVWVRGGCTSWYLDAQGVNRTLWPGSTWNYWRKTRSTDTGAYEFTSARD